MNLGLSWHPTLQSPFSGKDRGSRRYRRHGYQELV